MMQMKKVIITEKMTEQRKPWKNKERPAIKPNSTQRSWQPRVEWKVWFSTDALPSFVSGAVPLHPSGNVCTGPEIVPALILNQRPKINIKKSQFIEQSPMQQGIHILYPCFTQYILGFRDNISYDSRVFKRLVSTRSAKHHLEQVQK